MRPQFCHCLQQRLARTLPPHPTPLHAGPSPSLDDLKIAANRLKCKHPMLRALRHPAALIVAASIVFFARLGAAPLWDQDEPKNAQCAREMLARGDWIVPTFNETTRYDKPALVYWLIISAYQVFGVNEFAARFWSALLSVGTTLATVDLGRTLFGPRVGRWAGWIMASNLLFVMVGRAATPDAALIFCTTLAMLLFARGTWGSSGTLAGANALADYVPKSRFGFAGVYAALGVGVLAKGPVAVVLPIAALTCYLLLVQQALEKGVRNRLGRFRWTSWLVSPRAVWAVTCKMRLGTALLVIAGVALPWYLAVAWRTDGTWLAGFLGQHNVERFLNPLEGHGGSFFYYFPAIWIGLFPWSVFLLPALLQVPARLRRDANWSAWLFLASWAGVWIGFFSLSGTKLPSYVLPAYPALAVFVGGWIDRWLSAPQQAQRWALRGAWLALVIAGGAFTIVFFLGAKYLVPGEETIGLPGLVLAAAGIAGWIWSIRRPTLAAGSVAVAAVVFMVALFSYSAVRVGQHQNGAPLAGLARRGQSASAELATFEYDLPSLMFYSRGRVPKLTRPPEVAELFERSPDARLVVGERQFSRLSAVLPGDVAVLARAPRFLKRDEVLLLGRATGTARRVKRDR
jgi:4-amino-4-deoxy-L-arabinose transferase-like glycosyltransferase